MLEERTKTYV